MMGYEGGDLLLTGAAWPTVGSLPKPLCAGCGRWPGRLRLVTGAHLRWLDRWPSAYTKMRYTNRWPYPFLPFFTNMEILNLDILGGEVFEGLGPRIGVCVESCVPSCS